MNERVARVSILPTKNWHPAVDNAMFCEAFKVPLSNINNTIQFWKHLRRLSAEAYRFLGFCPTTLSHGKRDIYDFLRLPCHQPCSAFELTIQDIDPGCFGSNLESREKNPRSLLPTTATVPCQRFGCTEASRPSRICLTVKVILN